MKTGNDPVVVIPDATCWRRLAGFSRVVIAKEIGDVLPVLREAEAAALAGKIAAGFVSYEAAPAFDSAIATKGSGALPLAWFAIFSSFGVPPLGGSFGEDRLKPGHPTWNASLDETAYTQKVAMIRDAIARGETYQVNFTFPLSADFRGDAWQLFLELQNAQRGAHAMFIETDDFAICSASPELFFELDDDVIRCRPMKGTSSRGRWCAEDDAKAETLRNSEKNRAENLMIVDMVRNDLGRIAETGSVKSVSLFDVERYPNVWQMTSTIEAKTNASVVEIFGALFPSASITGAPKIQTSKIISEIEPAARGVYTGAIGMIGPGRHAKFNVAIRTAEIDKRKNEARFGIGSGVVWDSEPHDEFAECLAKAAVLRPTTPNFQLLETLRFEISNGWKFLDEHIARLAASARHFGFQFDDAAMRAALESAAKNAEIAKRDMRVRVLVDESGAAIAEAAPLRLPGYFEDRPVPTIQFMSAAISKADVNSGDVFLFHKTTNRAVYDRARASHPTVDEVLLVNERGELTEGTIGNIVLNIDGEFLTPPLDCGLLAGVFRQHLLARGAIREAVKTPYDLHRANAAYLINSVRGWSRLAMRS